MSYIAFRRFKYLEASQKDADMPDEAVAQAVEIGNKPRLPIDLKKQIGWEIIDEKNFKLLQVDNDRDVDDIKNRRPRVLTQDEAGLIKIKRVRDFSENLIDEFVLNNLKSGKTESQIENILNKTEKIIIALQTRSLKTALKKAKNLQPDADLSTEEILQFANKIRRFLGKENVSQISDIDS